MTITRRIFVSLPDDRWLSPLQNQVKWALVDRIEKLGYTAEIFLDPRISESLAGGIAWTAEAAEDVMRHCDGAAILGMPRWQFDTPHGVVKMPSEFSHYEGAIARSLQLPTLVIAEEDLVQRVVFDRSFRGHVAQMPSNADLTWLDDQSTSFAAAFGYWKKALGQRRDLFLGYCSKSTTVAAEVKHSLEARGATVLDWAEFDSASSVLKQIEVAASRTSAAVFLFTKDDEHAAEGGIEVHGPRDNVVFEAGYFISVKGKDRVLIILEEGAKLPADLGGDIYVDLKQRDDVQPITAQLDRFVDRL